MKKYLLPLLTVLSGVTHAIDQPLQALFDHDENGASILLFAIPEPVGEKSLISFRVATVAGIGQVDFRRFPNTQNFRIPDPSDYDDYEQDFAHHNYNLYFEFRIEDAGQQRIVFCTIPSVEDPLAGPHDFTFDLEQETVVRVNVDVRLPVRRQYAFMPMGDMPIPVHNRLIAEQNNPPANRADDNAQNLFAVLEAEVQEEN